MNNIPVLKDEPQQTKPRFENEKSEQRVGQMFISNPTSEIENKVVFDNINQKYLQTQTMSLVVDAKDQMYMIGSDRIILTSYDENGQLLGKPQDVTEIVCSKEELTAERSSSSNKSRGAKSLQQVQSKLQNPPSTPTFEDNMSVLRFKSVQQQMISPQDRINIAISVCGFEVSVTKQKKKESAGPQSQLVLTNMAFSSGVHIWEIICPISCQDIYVGAYDPLAKTEVMQTFFNTTPRSIFVCLDLNRGELKFWLNEHRLPHKTLLLKDHQVGRQWIPAIKISRERNKAILNPFPYLPSDFIEQSSDRLFSGQKLLIPHLFNTICVTGLPKMSTESRQAADQLKNFLHLSNYQLSKITLFKTQVSTQTIGSSGNLQTVLEDRALPENETLCFLQFYSYELMCDFIEYHKEREIETPATNQIPQTSNFSQSSKQQTSKNRMRSTSYSQKRGQTQTKSPDAAKQIPEESQNNSQQLQIKESNEISEGNLTQQNTLQPEKEQRAKFTILEPQEIIRLMLALDSQNEEEMKQTQNLETPLFLLRKEMRISEEKSIEETQKSITQAYQKLCKLCKGYQEDQLKKHCQSDVKLIRQTFSDKILVVKDSCYLKLLHRDTYTNEFNFDSQKCFVEPPRTLDARVTLTFQVSNLNTFFKFMAWQSMFQESGGHPQFLGFIKKVFDDIAKRSHLIVKDDLELFSFSQPKQNELNQSSYFQIQVKLLDMKYFIDYAIQHVKLALRRQSRDIEEVGQQVYRDRISLYEKYKLEFQDSTIPTLDELNAVLAILTDFDEQIWIQTKSNQCPSDVKNFMNSVSRPFSALSRLGSFLSFSITTSDLSQSNTAIESLADLNLIFKQCGTLNFGSESCSKAQASLSQLNIASLTNEFSFRKFLGDHHRMLSGQISQNVDLARSLNYQVPEVSAQQIQDVIPSVNSQLILVSKPNGVVQLHTSSLFLSEVKQLIMFKNEQSDKTYSVFKDSLKKLKSKEKDSLKCHQQILEKSSEIKLLSKISKPGYKSTNKQKVKVLQELTGTELLDQEDSQNLQLNSESDQSDEEFQKITLKKLLFQDPIFKTPSKYYGIIDSPKQTSPKKKKKKVKSKKTIAQDKAYDIAIIPDGFELQSDQGEGEPDAVIEPLADDKPATKDHGAEADDEVNLENEDNAKNQEEGIKTIHEKFEINQCKIQGYFLLTKPDHLRAIDPVLVGCLFVHIPSMRFFIRVKKLIYKINFLKQFVELDPDTGIYIDKITGQQMTLGKTNKSSSQDILEILGNILALHQEKIVDIGAIFQRSLASKASSKNKLDTRFQIFQEICEADLEIEDCQQIISFSKCSYSIEHQDSIGVLIQTQKGTQIRKYQVKEILKEQSENFFKNEPKKITLQEDKKWQMEITQSSQDYYQKLFLVEDKIVLCSQNSAKIISKSNTLKQISFSHGADLSQITIINGSKQSDENILYERTNENQINQDWRIVFKSLTNQLISYPLQIANENLQIQKQIPSFQKLIREASQDSINTIIQSLNPHYLPFSIQDSPYLQSRTFGKNNTIQTINMQSQFYSTDSLDFKIKFLPQSSQQIMNFKTVPQSIIAQLFLKIKDIEKAKLLVQELQNLQESPKQKFIQPKQIDLVLERWTGAQINDTHLPYTILTNNSQAFCSNYPEPEYTFRQLNDQMFIMKSFSVKSLVNRDSQGVPIGKGFLFAADSLEELTGTKQFVNRLNRSQTSWKPKDHYEPGEPIAFFDLESEPYAQFEILQQFQRPYRFVKLVPTGFRNAPINFSSIKFHSKRAELVYFGIFGEVFSSTAQFLNPAQNEINTNSTLQSFDQLFNWTRTGYNQALQFKTQVQGIVANNSKVKPDIKQILNGKLTAQYQPILKVVQNIQLPVSELDLQAQNIHFTLDQKGLLQKYGIELSCITVRISGRQLLQDLTSDALIDELKYILKIDAPQLQIVDNQITSTILYQLRLINQLLQINNIENEDFIKTFCSQLIQYLPKVLEQSLFLPTIEQKELYNLISQLIQKQNSFVQIIEEFVNSQLEKQFQNSQNQQSVDWILQIAKLTSFRYGDQGQNNIWIKIFKLLEQVSDLLVYDEGQFQNSLIPQVNTWTADEQKDLILNRYIVKWFGLQEQGLDLLKGNISLQTNQISQSMEKYLRKDLQLDQESSINEGNTLINNNDSCILSNLHLTEVFKINNLYHFNIDFQSAFRVKKIKLIFNEKNESFKGSFRIKVMILVPEIIKKNSDQVRMRSILNQIFDENQVQQVSIVAFKKKHSTSSADEQNQKKLSLNLDSQGDSLLSNSQDQLGVVTRYMTIQIQLMDTMRSSKENSLLNYQGLIFPQIFGLRTDQELKRVQSLDINLTEKSEKNVKLTHIGKESDLIYEVYPIDPSWKTAFANKSAIMKIHQPFAPSIKENEFTSIFQQIEQTQQTLRKILSEFHERQKQNTNLDEQDEKSVKKSANILVKKIKEFFQAYRMNFLAKELETDGKLKRPSYEDLIRLRESIANNLSQFLTSEEGLVIQMYKSQPQIYQELFYSLMASSVVENVAQRKGRGSDTFKNAYLLMQQLIKVISKVDKGLFYGQCLQNCYYSESEVTSETYKAEDIQDLDQLKSFFEDNPPEDISILLADLSSQIEDIQVEKQNLKWLSEYLVVSKPAKNEQLDQVKNLLIFIEKVGLKKKENTLKDLQYILKLGSFCIVFQSEQNYLKLYLNLVKNIIKNLVFQENQNLSDCWEQFSFIVLQICKTKQDKQKKQFFEILGNIFEILKKSKNEHILISIFSQYIQGSIESFGDSWLFNVIDILKICPSLIYNNKEIVDVSQKVIKNSLESIIKDEELPTSQYYDQWVQLFDMTLRLSLIGHEWDNPSPLDFFNHSFFIFDSNSTDSITRQGLQLQLYPIFLKRIQEEFKKSSKDVGDDKLKKVNETKVSISQVQDVCIQILKYILQQCMQSCSNQQNQDCKNLYQNNTKHELYFCYARSILSLLQSDGEMDYIYSLTQQPLKIEDLENITLNSETLRRQNSIVKCKMSTKNTFDLLQILSQFLKQKINLINYGGVVGADRTLIQKLIIAHQISSIIDLASQTDFQPNSKDSSSKIQKTCFQQTLISICDQSLSNIEIFASLLTSLIDWLLLQKDITKYEVSMQPSVSNLKQLQLSILSLLSQSALSEQIYDVENLNEMQKSFGLNLALGCLMKSVKKCEDSIEKALICGRIAQSRALHLQDNCNNIMTFLFKNWVITDQTAQRFLREHNGLNFMLNRLFTETEEEPEGKQVKAEITTSEQKLDVSEVKQKVMEKIKGIKKYQKKEIEVKQEEKKEQENMGISEVKEKLKEEQLANFMKIVYTSEKQSQAEQAYKHLYLAQYKQGQMGNKILQLVFSDHPQYGPDWNLILQLEDQNFTLSELSIGLSTKHSIYEKSMSYLPLIVHAQGGNQLNAGELTDLQWTVPLMPVFDQGLMMNDAVGYAANFDQSMTNLTNPLSKQQQIKTTKYIKISLRYPMTALLDSSAFYGQVHKPMNYTIQFITALGSRQLKVSQAQNVLVEIKKESSLKMLSQFFQGKFSQAFKALSSEKSIVEKIKEAFKRIQILLETKEELIKPIFISLCQDNDELCDWVLTEQILKHNTSQKKVISMKQAIFLGELINCQQKPKSYLHKLRFLYNYLISEIKQIAEGKYVLNDETNQKVFIKMINIYVKCLINIKNKPFKIQSNNQDSDYQYYDNDPLNEKLPNGELLFSFGKHEITSIIDYRRLQLQTFKLPQIQTKLKRSSEKFFITMLSNCSDGSNSERFTILQAAEHLLQQELKSIEYDKVRLRNLRHLDILTMLASCEEKVYQLLKNINLEKIQGDQISSLVDEESQDLIKIIINTLLNKKQDNQLVSTDQNQIEQKTVQILDINIESGEDQKQKKISNEDDQQFEATNILIQSLFYLSLNPKFYNDYGLEGALSKDLYENTIKNPYKHDLAVMLNPNLDENSVQILLKTIIQMILRKNQSQQHHSLNTMGKILKGDLKLAREKEDLGFINQVIFPLLHAEEQSYIRINFVQEDSKKQFPIFVDASALNASIPKTENDQVKSEKKQFFLKSDLLSDSMKQTLEKKMVEMRKNTLREVEQMVQSEWKMLYSQKKGEKGNNHGQTSSYWLPAGFKEMCEACEGKQNIIYLIKCKYGNMYYDDEQESNQIKDEKTVVVGAFQHSVWPSNLKNDWQHEFDYSLPFDPENFGFIYYMDGKMSHYEFTKNLNKPFGYLYTDQEYGGALCISADFCMVSWSQEFAHTFGNTEGMIPVDGSSIQVSSTYAMDPLEVQIWHYQPGVKIRRQNQNLMKSFKQIKSYDKDCILNYFSQNLVFLESQSKPLGLILNEYFGKDPTSFEIQGIEKGSIGYQNTIKDLIEASIKQGVYSPDQSSILDINIRLLQEEEIKNKIENVNLQHDELLGPALVPTLSFGDSVDKDKSNEIVYEHKQHFPILKNFEEEQGVYDLISVAIAVVMTYKQKKAQKTWIIWLKELQQFSLVPNFFNYFSQDFLKAQTIYKLISRVYDIDPNSEDAKNLVSDVKDYEQMCNDHVKYTYQVIDRIFSENQEISLRQKCLENGTYAIFLDRLAELTSETKRRKKSDQKEEEKKTAEKIIEPAKKEVKDSNEVGKVKKGVGYTTGSGLAWDVDRYLQMKEAKSKQICVIVNSFINSIKTLTQNQSQEPEKIQNILNQMQELILESAILPILEQALRSGSILEMAKETMLYNSYLDLVAQLANTPQLASLLQKISSEFVPEQRESLIELLSKIAGQSKIFLQCLKVKNPAQNQGEISDQDKQSEELAERIIKTFEIVDTKAQEVSRANKKEQLQILAQLPLDDAYKQILQPLRFDYMNMKKGGTGLDSSKFLHAYDDQAQQTQNVMQSKVIRLAQEIADLSNSLPCDPTNAMFCRVDKDRVDMMKVMIMGAAGTPYGHGAFVYDLFFPNNYPQSPPKCLLTTTGGGTVRFNPNLYNQGKVCLSLLGTWRGSQTEMWDPKLSTILQLVLSIQAIIMSNEVYFNEPNYEHEMNTIPGEKKNRGYQNIVKYCNVKFAIIDTINNPPKGFETAVRRSFYLKKQMILDEVKQWCEEASTADQTATYDGLVYEHNYHWAPQISKPGAYKQMMDDIYKELEKTLNSIKNPFDDLNEVPEEEAKQEEKVKVNVNIKGEDLDNIDMSYKEQELQTIDITDERVKDRWSRYIGAMGIEAVAKQAEARVLLVNLGALGVEVAKNIVLAGCKELVILDNFNNSNMEWGGFFSGQFFMEDQKDEKLIKSIAVQCKHKLQELNRYVRVTVIDCTEFDTDSSNYLNSLAASIGQTVELTKKNPVTSYLKSQKLEGKQMFRAVLFSQVPLSQDDLQDMIQANNFCRTESIPFIMASVTDAYARIFNDFGPEFTVLESNAEEIPEVMIQNIEANQDKNGEAKITMIQGFKHQFTEEDYVCLREVKGLTKFITNASGENDISQISSSTTNETVNGKQFKVIKVINREQFVIDLDLLSWEVPYEQGGVAYYVKTPKVIKHQSLFDCFNKYEQFIKKVREDIQAEKKEITEFSLDDFRKLMQTDSYLDQNLYYADFEKIEEIEIFEFAYNNSLINMILQDKDNDSSMVGVLDQLVFDELIAQECNKQTTKKNNLLNLALKITSSIFQINNMAPQNVLPPVAAFLGGIVAQEIVKAITQKFMPISQTGIFSFSEVMPQYSFKMIDFKMDREFVSNLYEHSFSDLSIKSITEIPDREMLLRQILGNKLVEKIKSCKVFMVGAGAIGCELLKNFGMLGLGSGDEGHIIVTDPDVIEVSNLNRQFLFREQHLRKPKSSTAAAAVIQMNPALKGHIYARLDKIHDGTADIYSEAFYMNQTLVTNALDNVQARQYIDKKCVEARVPMIDSGTLGPKGHVQVVLPMLTESYNSQKDPEVNNDIPHCTLKMFPEETLHCVEWAKDLFGNWFSLNPQSFNKFTDEHLNESNQPNKEYFTNLSYDTQAWQVARKTAKMYGKTPQNFDDCIVKARKKFQSLFNNSILQLLHTYPVDKLNSDGRSFWSLPKRPPHPVIFDASNPIHQTFISSYAYLYANLYKIDAPGRSQNSTENQENLKFIDSDNPRSVGSRKLLGELAAGINVEPYVVNEQKSKEIQAQVDKEKEQEDQSEQQEQVQEQKQFEKEKTEKTIEQLLLLTQNKILLNVEEFEKDSDQNFHIDLIYSMANIRASNYNLATMDWITVKIKAGRIVPALATTTAAIAGLQTIELIKILKELPLTNFRNAFLNLAVPSLMLGEPGAAQKFTLSQSLSVTLWDRWSYDNADGSTTLKEILQKLEEIHKGELEFRDIFKGGTPIFMYSIQEMQMKAQGKSVTDSESLSKPLSDLLNLKDSNLPDHIDLTITFIKKDENKILENVPEVRINFTKNDEVKEIKPLIDESDEYGDLMY